MGCRHCHRERVVENSDGEDERRLLEYEVCPRDKDFWPELLGRWWAINCERELRKRQEKTIWGEVAMRLAFVQVSLDSCKASRRKAQ